MTSVASALPFVPMQSSAKGNPHGLGTFKETSGFSAGGGIFGTSHGNRGENGIK
jgi:hypothetical protein